MNSRAVIGVAAVALAAAVAGTGARGWGSHGAGEPEMQGTGAAARPPVDPASRPAGAETIEVPPPPFTDGIFPCTGCHAAMTVNRTRRALTDMHTDIELRHDEAHRWCLDCHDAQNRDVLHLASGEAVPFEESYRLCGQCHGEKLRDWRAGVHGRRTGQWNGHKKYLLCAHCHNPHQPRFAKIEPKPAPVRPGGRVASAHEARSGTRIDAARVP